MGRFFIFMFYVYEQYHRKSYDVTSRLPIRTALLLMKELNEKSCNLLVSNIFD